MTAITLASRAMGTNSHDPNSCAPIIGMRNSGCICRGADGTRFGSLVLGPLRSDRTVFVLVDGRGNKRSPMHDKKKGELKLRWPHR